MRQAGLRYIDVCSGISAPTMAWKSLGWEALCFAEIEPFPRAVLAHHYPDVPLNGDFTQIKGDEYGPVDLLVGGTPCQSFSVAGLRGGMADGRGNLALEYIRLAHRARARWVVWENVPGVFSSNQGEDFRCFLSGLVRWDVPLPEGGWSNAGVIAAGPADGAYGVAWRVLDAQFAGVPQRRRRVFVVGYLGDWRRAAAVLFERHSLSGDTPPRREKGQNAPTIPSRSSAGGGLGTDFDCDGGLISTHRMVAFGEYADDGTASAIKARDFKDATDLVAHSLRGEGFDASEDGTGRGTPLVPVAIQERAVSENPDAGPDGAGFRTDGQAYTLEARSVPQAIAFDTTQITSKANYSNPKAGDPCHPLAAGAHTPCIAFSAKDHGADAQENLSPTLRAGGHSKSHTNAGVMPAVAFGIRSDASREGEAKTPSADAEGRVRLRNPGLGVYEELAPTVDASCAHTVATSAVRRLTPVECERLQGFPDNFTLVPYRNKPAADGPRYKALGNSMAVPVVRWIGERIASVETMAEQAVAA